MTNKLDQFVEYVGTTDCGQAWDDHLCEHAIKLLSEFAPEDWLRLAEIWPTSLRNFKNCFLSIVTEMNPADYGYAVPLILKELQHDEELLLMEAVRHFLKAIPETDPVWQVEQELVADLTKRMRNLNYRATFLQDVLTRLNQ